MSAFDRLWSWLLYRGEADPGPAAARALAHAMLRVTATLTAAARGPGQGDEAALCDAAEVDQVAFLWLGSEVAAGELALPAPGGRGPTGALVRALLPLLDLDLPAEDHPELLRLLLLAEARAQDVPLEPLVALAEHLDLPALTAELRGRVEARAPHLLPRIDGIAPRAGDLLDAYLAETLASRSSAPELTASPAAQAILKGDPAARAAILTRALIELSSLSTFANSSPLRALVGALLRRTPTLDEAQALAVVRALRWAGTHAIPWPGVVRLMARHVEVHGVDALRDELEALAHHLREDAYAEPRKAGEKLAALGAPRLPMELPIDEGPWRDLVQHDIAGPTHAAWVALLRHAGSATASRPTKAWSKEAARLVATIGVEPFSDCVIRWLEAAQLGAHPGSGRWLDFQSLSPSELGQSAGDCDVMRGLVWAAAPVDDPRLPRAIGRLAARCFRKVRGWGARSPKLGNGAVYALGAMPGTVGVAHLSRLASRVRYPSGRAQIDKALAVAARKAGVSRDEIEEMGVPDFGLVDGVRREAVGDWEAELSVTDTRDVELRWLRGGQAQKSPPKALKEVFQEEITALEEERRELKDVLAGQAARIERTWLERTAPWRYVDWRDRYLDHGLVGIVARKLVWTVDGVPVLWADGALRDLDGQLVSPPDDAPVTLWHPITSDAATIGRWRARIEALELRQPVKQVWREVYAITPAEEETATYSRRYAAHVLRQHAFHALAQVRGWQFRIMGPWDGDNTPLRDAAGWRISWWLDGIEDPDDPGHAGFRLVSTDQVRFEREGGQVPLREVPAIVFSELMRDIDLFVSVCSIGTEPDWVAGRHHAYWDAYAFGELTELGRTRAAVLERLLPRLRIRDVARVEGRWLVVKGKRDTYRIHLASTNILMEDRGYLCIVPDRSQREGERVLLPFEGDDVLSVVLSKAFLLADDDQITDPGILTQIVR